MEPRHAPAPRYPVSALSMTMPVSLRPYEAEGRIGLIVVDEVNGFCTPGNGPLAPPAADPAVEAMVSETDALARRFLGRGMPVLAFRDRHSPDRPEYPYPPHCIEGSGHDELVERLAWLESAAGAEVMDKDCINGLVGAIRADGGNHVFDWIRRNRLEAVAFVGICTDICVLDAVVTLLSARNHWIDGRPMLDTLKDVVVHEPGCATYDLPLDAALSLGLPASAAHPAADAHHVGLWTMQSRGAVLSDGIILGS